MLPTLLIYMLTQAPAQAPPWKAENLQFYPKDIARAELTQRMREFSFSLGVRCQYCHVGGNGVSFDGVVFSSDEKPAKKQARAMLRMVEQINTVALAQMPSHSQPKVVVECSTCHRGVSIPKSLQTMLFEIAQSEGAPAAVAKYRELRRDAVLGQYNFGEWEINELARRLNEAKNTKAALAVLEMNLEYYPASQALPQMIAAAKKLIE